MSEVIRLASSLEGQCRLKDGALVVFVEPETKPCPDTDCDRVHTWLDGSTVRSCS